MSDIDIAFWVVLRVQPQHPAQSRRAACLLDVEAELDQFILQPDPKECDDGS
jgi:hypothetical protein